MEALHYEKFVNVPFDISCQELGQSIRFILKGSRMIALMSQCFPFIAHFVHVSSDCSKVVK